MAGLSPKLPLMISDLDGAYALTKTFEEMIEQNLKNLLLTNPGERIMDPLFGVGLKTFLFEMNTTVQHDQIRKEVIKQTTTYMPFIDVSSVLIDSTATNEALDENMIAMSVIYTIPALGKTTSLELAINV